MSDPVMALSGARYDGFATIREIGPLGIITLRATPDAVGLAQAIKACVGTDVPDRRQILRHAQRAAAWMSPDEYLLILPYDETQAALITIAAVMSGSHHLAVVVSDARAVFRIEGPKADMVLAKLAPVDLQTLPEGELRRTRLAQVAAAFWWDGEAVTLVCFRSVARYAFDVLSTSARPGSD